MRVYQVASLYLHMGILLDYLRGLCRASGTPLSCCGRRLLQEHVRSLILAPVTGEEVKAMVPVAQSQRVVGALLTLVESVERASLSHAACDNCQVRLHHFALQRININSECTLPCHRVCNCNDLACAHFDCGVVFHAWLVFSPRLSWWQNPGESPMGPSLDGLTARIKDSF